MSVDEYWNWRTIRWHNFSHRHPDLDMGAVLRLELRDDLLGPVAEAFDAMRLFDPYNQEIPCVDWGGGDENT